MTKLNLKFVKFVSTLPDERGRPKVDPATRDAKRVRGSLEQMPGHWAEVGTYTGKHPAGAHQAKGVVVLKDSGCEIKVRLNKARKCYVIYARVPVAEVKPDFMPETRPLVAVA